jgi:hypothetical protein
MPKVERESRSAVRVRIGTAAKITRGQDRPVPRGETRANFGPEYLRSVGFTRPADPTQRRTGAGRTTVADLDREIARAKALGRYEVGSYTSRATTATIKESQRRSKRRG